MLNLSKHKHTSKFALNRGKHKSFLPKAALEMFKRRVTNVVGTERLTFQRPEKEPNEHKLAGRRILEQEDFIGIERVTVKAYVMENVTPTKPRADQ